MMKRRIFTAVLAAAMVLSLAACGGGNGGGASSSNPGSSSSANGSGSSSSQPDASTPDAATPDASNPDGSVSSGSASGGASSAVTPTLTLNKTSVKLTKAGATFQLRYTAEPDTDGIASFTSSDKKIATVSEDGTIKAVAPGKATITVTYDGATATADVTCDWKVETKPDSKPDASNPGSSSSSGSGSSSSGSSSSPSVNLSDFYTTITGKYEFGFLELADSGLLDQYYSGLTGVSTEQMLVYIIMMSMNNGEFGLVQVKDSKDVDTVKAIFQARINYMVGDDTNPGGALYPGPTEQWKNNSRVVSNGNYVMMVIHENCDDIVDEFNALF